MANEVTIPLLPCESIDEIAEFYGALGFERTYRQTRPNPYLALQREDFHLHFFGLPDFDPDQSYGSCLVNVPDTGALYQSFAAGMRAAYGKLLVSGIPRMTRPRKRRNASGLAGFTIVDPGGNWIRIFPSSQNAGGADPVPSKLARALQNAVVLGDSKGDHLQAARILDGTLAREQDSAQPVDLVEVLVYRAELALMLDDGERAGALLAQVREMVQRRPGTANRYGGRGGTRALRSAIVAVRQLLKRILYGRRYDHVPWPQQVYLRPGERHLRRWQGWQRVRRARTMPLADYRAAVPLGEIEEFLDCPLCDESRQQPLYRPRDRKRGWDYRVVRCPGCGFLYRNPNVRPEHLGDLYATGYSKFLTGRYAQNRQRRYRATMAAVAPVFEEGKGRRLLDFGCGAGLFLELAEQDGFEAYGVDLSPDSVAQARQRLSSAKVFHGSPVDTDEIAGGGFDVVTLWSVLAHLPRPVEDLSMLRGLLTDDGLLVILTVNAGSLHLRGLGSRWQGFTRNHLMFYSRDTLPRLLGKAGFAAVGFAPFYGDEIVSGDSALTPAELVRLERRVAATDFGSMLVAVAFATDAAADRWGTRLPDLRPTTVPSGWTG